MFATKQNTRLKLNEHKLNQGSGKGMFATTKWKTKLLAAHAGMALYFDSIEISQSNQCAQVLWPRVDA